MSGVGSLGISGRSDSKELEKDYSNWMKGIEYMHGVICDFANKYINNFKGEYKSAVRKALRAAEQGKSGTMNANLTKARMLYLTLNMKDMPQDRIDRITGKYPKK